MIYPAISLWQPWASALFLSYQDERLKTHETRHWRPPPALIGRRVAIHAAKRTPPVIDFVTSDVLAAAVGPDWRRALPRGVVLGTAVLESAAVMGHSGAQPANETDELFGDWTPGRFAWRMADPQLLAEPVPYSGLQGWFQVDLP